MTKSQVQLINQEGRLPNFLIVGAPKAGTTAIYHYLEQHPDIYMSSVKEPQFFQFFQFFANTDPIYMKFNVSVSELNDYLNLFRNVTTQIISGEATATYLCSPHAAENIKTLIPDVKIIAILRDPSERAYSQYVAVRTGNRFTSVSKGNPKSVENYSQVIRRLRQPLTLPLTEEEYHLGLRMSFYSDDIQRYFNIFSKEQIKILLYEDLKKSPIETLQNVFRFLGVDSSFVPDITQKHNVTNIPKNNWLDHILIGSNGLKNLLKLLIPAKIRKPIVKSIYQVNLKPYESLKKEDRALLIEIFREDILQTQKLIERDLSNWLQV